MSLFADLLSTVFDRQLRLGRLGRDDARPVEALCRDLLSASGEVSSVTLARRILARYADMEDTARSAFFDFLSRDMAVDTAAVRASLSALEAGEHRDSYRTFMEAAEPPRQELFRRLNHVPGATGLLVKLRADLLRLGGRNDQLAPLDLDLRHLFSSWFNRGFLVLRPITWQSPANILEKIIEYEAVHAIGSWEDLQRRLQPPDRRCFAFFHPAMPDEPLIFVEVALTRGIPSSVQSVLAQDRTPMEAEEADTAVFYSISNCQAGLAGISFGNSLIKQVAADLALSLPGLKTFVTLSPIPGLAAWAAEEGIPLDPAEPERLRQIAADYLLNAKGYRGHPRDPVARFHLGNGARVEHVHAGADVSAKGQAQSAGAMVNYLYDLPRVAQNHERFASGGEIAASSELRALATAAQKTKPSGG